MIIFDVNFIDPQQKDMTMKEFISKIYLSILELNG